MSCRHAFPESLLHADLELYGRRNRVPVLIINRLSQWPFVEFQALDQTRHIVRLGFLHRFEGPLRHRRRRSHDRRRQDKPC